MPSVRALQENIPNAFTITGALTIQLAGSSLVPIVATVGGQQYRSIQNLSLNLAVTGAGGLDTGSVAANTTYYIHLVASSGSLALLASTSKTAPTGFTSFKYTGYAFFVGSTSQIILILLPNGLSDWQTYSPTYTNFTVSAVSYMQWRRVGSNVEIRGEFNIATITGTYMGVSIPLGITPIQSAFACGKAGFFDVSPGLRYFTGSVQYDVTSNRLEFYGDSPAAGSYGWGSVNPNTPASPDKISFECSLPITGLPSNTA